MTFIVFEGLKDSKWYKGHGVVGFISFMGFRLLFLWFVCFCEMPPQYSGDFSDIKRTM